MLFPDPIETDRLVLRQLKEEDLAGFMRFFDDEESHRYLAPGVVYQVKVRGLMPQILAQWITVYYIDDDVNTMVAVSEKGRDALAGFVGFEKRKIDAYPRLVYCIQRDYWGKGYATEASKKVLAHFFKSTNWKRVEALVDPQNIASVRVAEKVGMMYEKMVRDPEFLDEQRLYAVSR